VLLSGAPVSTPELLSVAVLLSCELPLLLEQPGNTSAKEYAPTAHAKPVEPRKRHLQLFIKRPTFRAGGTASYTPIQRR
jgi:hypothetical protein